MEPELLKGMQFKHKLQFHASWKKNGIGATVQENGSNFFFFNFQCT